MAKIARAWAPAFVIGLPALGVMVLGAVVLAGWLLRRPGWLIPVEGSVSMVASAAVGFVIAGAGLLLAMRNGQPALRWRWTAGVLLMALGAAALTEHVVGVPLGIDFPDLHRRLAAQGAAAGRMAPSTAFAFLLTGALLLAFDRPRDRGRALAVQLLTGVLLALGIVSLVAHDVPPEGLIPWYRYSRMAAPTAAAFVAIGVALLALIARSSWYESVYAQRADEKILILGLGILTLVLLGTAAAGFVMVHRNLEDAVRGNLAQAVTDRRAILDNLIGDRVTRARIVATRPGVGEALARWAARRDDGIRARLRSEGASYLELGFRGLEFLDAADLSIETAGALVADPALEAAIAGGKEQASLLWNGAFVLRVRTPVLHRGALVGSVVSDQVLEILPRLQFEVGDFGDTAEWMLCAPREQRMACFPQRFRRAPWEGERRRPGGASPPMDRALSGQAGTADAIDDDGRRIMASYGPAAQTGLGVVLKVEAEEFYAPLRNQIGRWWQWFFAMALLGALLLASQVRPVVQRLVRSENLARGRADALARSEKALRELYASLGDGIVVLGSDGVIEFLNPAAERLFGYPAGELVGRPVGALIPEELRAANESATRGFLAGEPSKVVGRGELVYPALRRDGSRFDLEFSLAPMRLGDELKLVAVLRDVSERAALERMKGEFIAAVSHELRTPLTSIMGSLEILRETAELPEPERGFLEMAWRNSERLALLVDDVLDTERIESGALRFDESEFTLEEFLREAVDLNRSFASRHGISFRLVEPVPSAQLRLDRGRLLQVMANLLSNAAKFSRRGEEVRVRAELRGGRVRVEVIDRGRGIPDEFKPRMFEKFAQADASDSRDKGGTGLGLSICKAIVERLGGAIGFDSRWGEGTTFWFELPASQ